MNNKRLILKMYFVALQLHQFSSSCKIQPRLPRLAGILLFCSLAITISVQVSVFLPQQICHNYEVCSPHSLKFCEAGVCETWLVSPWRLNMPTLYNLMMLISMSTLKLWKWSLGKIMKLFICWDFRTFVRSKLLCWIMRLLCYEMFFLEICN